MPKVDFTRLGRIFLSLSVIVFTVFYTFLPSPVYSQENPNPEKTAFDLQFEDYIAKTKVYDTAHADYVLKRSQYLKFKTLTAQEDAVDSTLAMLIARNDVVVSYLRTLKEKILAGDDIPDEVAAVILISIDDEIEWLIQHQGTTATAGTLDDLTANSQEASIRFERQKAVFYQALSIISRGRSIGYERRTTELYEALKKKLEEIRNETREEYAFTTEKFQILDRWMFDAETRIQRARQKNLDVADYFTEKVIKSKSENALSAYNQTLTTLGQAQLYLKEANTFLGEVIREVKIK